MAEQLDAGLLDPELNAAQRRRRSQAARAAAMGGGRLPRLRHWLWGRRSAEPVPAVLGVREPPKPGRRGICCSGGGVRSASFNLGALQALQAQPHRILQQSKYIAAVSGGSYIAAAFAMVAKVDGSEASDPDLVDDDAPPFHPGSPEEQYLRNRSTYMAPGALGKVRLAARVVLGMIVNLLFLGALLLLLGWALGWLYSEALYPALAEPGGSADTRNAGIAAGAVLVASMALGLLATVHGFERERWTRFLQAWAGRLLVVALLTALLGIALPELLEWLRDVKPKAQDGAVKGSRSAAAALGGTSAAALLAGTLLQLRAKLLDRRILRQSAQAVGKGVRGYVSTRVWPRLRSGLQLLLVAAVGPLLLGGILLASLVASLADQGQEPWILLGFALAVFVGLYAAGDVTSWSLHPFYRQRLCTVFALKRVSGKAGDPAVAVQRDYDRIVPLSESGVEPVPAPQKGREWPLLVVCAAANVSDPGATPPGRAVTSFTFSPNAIGGPLIGAVSTKHFEEQLDHRKRDFSLPAAVAMSGAALSPSMGKATRWPLRFLLTLANARLGVWVPNPRRIDEVGWLGKRLYWRPRAALIFNELLGLNSADAKFLYVTDGGHYENLGLVELLRRGCTEVLCVDASGGTDVQELGDAIALARTELGVEVDIRPADLVPDPATGMAAANVKEGGILYPDGTRGRLIYVRSVLTDKATHDVLAYHDRDPAFPHNSTGDQLYTDQRFEAYRKLGHQAGCDAIEMLLRPSGA